MTDILDYEMDLPLECDECNRPIDQDSSVYIECVDLTLCLTCHDDYADLSEDT
jgi:hypothetical protein